ncbi:estradiol 17-beta-dehydrogenase 8 [Eupeodes corollae]|uniref:estradiol 17-beta-dehydrogenase 8 n=1 Tax=Eupeodes corollae TaxID=290404 RepID=UPI0024936CF7|nr:estradiol 17-beta-dehydrogenase 8 [Eupeodes corollae]
MPGPLFGKLAIVTGAGSGIGRAVCKVLARDGARIIAADKNIQTAMETISNFGAESSAVEVDVSSLDSVCKALDTCIKKYKQPPSIVVNSAGITRDCYLLKMEERDYDDVYKVNLKGTFLITQQFAKAMVQYKVSGSIVNISSIAAKLTTIGQANYAASKSGVISFTEVAAKEFGKFNIRVNSILPGYIDTPMVDAVPEHIKEKVSRICPLGRLGQPEEVAEVISFLASKKASYINGASVEVTGGLS